MDEARRVFLYVAGIAEPVNVIAVMFGKRTTLVRVPVVLETPNDKFVGAMCESKQKHA
jgi:hypothetical protein